MSTVEAVLTQPNGCGERRGHPARPIRIRIGPTSTTLTELQCARLLAAVNDGAISGIDLTDYSGRPSVGMVCTGVTSDYTWSHTLWKVADQVVPGLIWIAGLLFAAAGLPH